MHELVAAQISTATRADGTLDVELFTRLVAEAYAGTEDARVEALNGELAAARASLAEASAQHSRELRDSRNELKLQNKRMAVALDSTGYAISIFDGRKRLVYCNRYFLDLYHLPKHLGRQGTSFLSVLRGRISANSFVGEDKEAYLAERLNGVDRRRLFTDVQRLNTGETVSIYHVPLPDGGWVATHKDITEYSRLQDELAYRANHDALTGLGNRHLLQDRLAECFNQAGGAESFALLLIDLDGFKQINDTLGHAAGDAVLRELAQRIEQSTGDAAVAARMGGDEFAVVMDVGALGDDARALAARLIEASRLPLLVDGQAAEIGFSIGVAVAPDDGATPEQLLKSADLALYAAKHDRRGSYRFFEPAMDKALRDRHALERDLGLALERGEFELEYQPVFSLVQQGLSGFEALLRWRRGGSVSISPAQFIPVAEETGLIVPIGEWVLREAIAEASHWPDHVRIAVNVSSVQFQRGNVVTTVLNALGAAGLAADRLEIEITESVLFENSSTNLDALRQLHALGCKIALDDFGTGFSALSYLLSYPFDKIKIDGSFVRALDTAGGAHAIVQAIAEIGHHMGITTTAEGVETAEQLRNVYAAGYTEAQGYLIARPMPAENVRRLLGDEEGDSMPLAPLRIAG